MPSDTHFLHHVEQGDLPALLQHPRGELLSWRSQKRGNTLFHHAARHVRDPAALVPFLIQWGLDLQARNRLGEVPVMCIFERPAEQTLEWMDALVQQGSRLDLHDLAGRSFVSQCTRYHHWAALERAVGAGAQRHVEGAPWTGAAEHPLYQQLRNRRVDETDLMRWLDQLDAIAPPVAADQDRSFMLAVRHGAFRCAQRLHDGGARPDTLDDKGNTLLHLLAEHAKIKRPLPNACFHWAQQAVANGVPWRGKNDDKNTVERLLSAAADPDHAHALRRAIAEGEAMHLQQRVAPSITLRPARARI